LCRLILIARLPLPLYGGGLVGFVRWLVTGACGQLGAYVMTRLARDRADVFGVSRRPCSGSHGPLLVSDLSEPSAVVSVLKWYRPNRIVHLATVSSPAAAHLDTARARRLELGVTSQLADYVAATGGWLLYGSSDYVWGGRLEGRRTEGERPSPTTEYGAMKLAGEDLVRARGCGAVARFSLMYGLPLCPRPTTWNRLVNALKAGEPVPAYVDEFRTPLALRDAADVVVELGWAQHRGLVQLAGPHVLSPHSMFGEIAAELGLEPNLIATGRNQHNDLLSRPRNVSQDDSLIRPLLQHSRIEPICADGIRGAPRSVGRTLHP
jgi:dTDP-4-dehydrorhamnose reductase